MGNRLRVVESSGNRVTWSYDKVYQLRNEQRSGSNRYNITYTYDPVGNRLVLINGGVSTTSTYDAANELSASNAFSVGITTYTSDSAGNLLSSLSPSGQRTTNTWDFENRLTQVALPSAVVDTFTYNGDGQRVQKIDSTGTTKHVWDGQNILLETNASNIVQVVYTLQPMLYGNLISQWRGGIGSFYIFDGPRLDDTTDKQPRLSDGQLSVRFVGEYTTDERIDHQLVSPCWQLRILPECGLGRLLCSGQDLSPDTWAVHNEGSEGLFGG